MILTASLPRSFAAVALLLAFYAALVFLWRIGPRVYAAVWSSYIALDSWSRSDPATTHTPGVRRAR